MGSRAVLIGVCVFAVPLVALAVDIEANIQCPPGGAVGQPCKDNTNGYITSGKCTHIYICKADQYKSNPPQSCAGGRSDCPTGGQPPKPEPQRFTSGPVTAHPNASSSPITGILEIFGDDPQAAPAPTSVRVDSRVTYEDLVRVGEVEPGALLSYAPESFDTGKSTLFASLRDSVATLTPGGQLASTTVASELHLAYAGTFGSVGAPYVADASVPASLEARVFGLSALSLLGKTVSEAARAFAYLVFADFSEAAKHFEAAHTHFLGALALIGQLCMLLFELIIEIIRRVI